MEGLYKATENLSQAERNENWLLRHILARKRQAGPTESKELGGRVEVGSVVGR